MCPKLALVDVSDATSVTKCFPANAFSVIADFLMLSDITIKRKIEKKRDKVLYHESLLKRNPFVQPIPSSVVSKKDKKKAKKKELQETRGEKSVPMVLAILM